MTEKRKEQLIEIIGEENKKLLLPLVEKIVFLEDELEKLQKVPFFKLNPQNNTQQKILPAFKIYKELLQQYNNSIKLLRSCITDNAEESDTPIDKWFKERIENVNNREKNLDTG